MLRFIKPIWAVLLIAGLFAISCGGPDIGDSTPASGETQPRRASNDSRFIGIVPTLCAEDVAVYGGYVYVADGPGGIAIINASDPQNPAYIRAIDTEYAIRVTVYGNHLYVCDGPGGFYVYSLDTPGSPSRTYTYESSWATGLAIHNGYLYLSDYNTGVKVFRLDDPGRPSTTTGSISAHARDIDVDGETLVISDPAYGLVVYNLEDPVAPKWTYIDMSRLASFEDVVSHNGYSIIARNDDLTNITVYTSSDPANVQMIDAIEPARFIEGMTGCGDVLLLACGEEGVMAYDMQNPSTLHHLWTMDTIGHSRRSTISGNVLYVADMAGLSMYDLSGLGGDWN